MGLQILLAGTSPTVVGRLQKHPELTLQVHRGALWPMYPGLARPEDRFGQLQRQDYRT